jgi:hypothetical protein
MRAPRLLTTWVFAISQLIRWCRLALFSCFQALRGWVIVNAIVPAIRIGTGKRAMAASAPLPATGKSGFAKS